MGAYWVKLNGFIGYKIEEKNMQWRVALLLGGIYALFYFSIMLLPIAEFFYQKDNPSYLHQTIFFRMLGGQLDVQDTKSYIIFQATRTAFYPMFLKILTAIGFSYFQITMLQLALFIMALTALLYQLLQLRISLALVLVFYMGMILNLYLNQFHFVILSESLSLSLILGVMLGMMRYIFHRQFHVLLLVGLLIGVLCGIRPAMYPFAIGLVITIICLHWRQWRVKAKYLLLGCLMPLFAMLLLENIVYHSYHPERKTLAIRHLGGKAALITQFDSFNKEKLPKEWRPAFDYLDGEMQVAPKRVSGSNFVNFYGNLEAQIYGIMKPAVKAILGSYHAPLEKTITYQIILTHPLQYIALTSLNYAALFNVTGVLFYPFMFFGIILMAFSLYCALRFMMRVFMPHKITLNGDELVAMNLLLWAQGYNLFIALTTVGFSRFLMLSYPMIILGILLIGANMMRYVYGRKINRQ